ncbi:bifunctional tetrahydrofolate synthase/dihydrofolate synthase [Methylocaldum szegediense]|uniref:Dihydrofolate synthase/folylpolyglutamate synthase n=1 Tax=Methylocaldum szegediense TaxID=73780 RepID=A0ABN8X018_9GAMM|nr:bifunctional tetrahydrofolate synthase/dihydrofolate synthase [Methylocaldum szegediense]CAI8747427.1 bifunctional folylpolyglutamate synthetase/dihydrofolate synthetase [Methylocaldum szegediense]
MRFKTLADWLAWQEALHPKSIDLGLFRVKKVYERLGRRGPMPYTITVGGTNGKGSCVAMLDAILRRQGYRVGTYTSPHLLRYNERICIDGEPVGDDPICDAFERIDRVRDDTTLSFFEFGTLAALDIFAAADLDVQVLEVGLGGRLDAVNIVDANAALIASIDLDHQDWLGDTRTAIGLEKAGIFRPGKPAVIGDIDVPAAVVQYAEEHGVPLSWLGRDFTYEMLGGGWNWIGRDARLDNLPLPALQGVHQMMNASAVLETLHRIEHDVPVSAVSIRDGLKNVSLAGRFQYIPGSVPVLLDVAHNPQAVKVLADYLRSRFEGKTIHAVFAVMRDKDISGIVNNIKDLIQDWYLAPLQMSRAATAEQLLAVFDSFGVSAVRAGFADAAAAFDAAKRDAATDHLVLVFGSFFLVSEYLAHMS